MGSFHYIGRFFKKNNREKAIENIFFGLGNPGKKYASTRHNVGFRVIDSFNKTLNERRSLLFPDAECIRGVTEDGITVASVKPLTFMNRSGCAVEAVLKKWKVPPGKCLVIVDDLNLPLGVVRARRRGSHGGHNGLKSVIERIGCDFPRLRIGIGPCPEKTDIIDFVLGDFTESEEAILKGILSEINEALELFAAKGIDAVMNYIN